MKEGWKIEQALFTKKDTVIIVSNYKDSNTVIHWPFISLKGKTIDKTDIGVWRIKQK